MRLLTPQLVTQPGPNERPLTFERPLRHTDDVRRRGNAQTAEITQFDNFRVFRIQFGEFAQCVVDPENLSTLNADGIL
jgi:hypothetical protein